VGGGGGGSVGREFGRRVNISMCKRGRDCDQHVVL
jgi:hypothetical protein